MIATDFEQLWFLTPPPPPLNDAFVFPYTDADTDTDRLAQNPMGIYVGVCLCVV